MGVEAPGKGGQMGEGQGPGRWEQRAVGAPRRKASSPRQVGVRSGAVALGVAGWGPTGHSQAPRGEAWGGMRGPLASLPSGRRVTAPLLPALSTWALSADPPATAAGGRAGGRAPRGCGRKRRPPSGQAPREPGRRGEGPARAEPAVLPERVALAPRSRRPSSRGAGRSERSPRRRAGPRAPQACGGSIRAPQPQQVASPAAAASTAPHSPPQPTRGSGAGRTRRRRLGPAFTQDYPPRRACPPAAQPPHCQQEPGGRYWTDHLTPVGAHTHAHICTHITSYTI